MDTYGSFSCKDSQPHTAESHGQTLVRSETGLHLRYPANLSVHNPALGYSSINRTENEM